MEIENINTSSASNDDLQLPLCESDSNVNKHPRSPSKEDGVRKLYVSNLPYSIKCEELKALFCKEVGEVTHAELLTDSNNVPKGVAIVEMETADLAELAKIKLNRYAIDNRRMVVKILPNYGKDPTWKPVDGRDELPFQVVRPHVLPDCGDLVWRETYGLSFKFLEKLKLIPPLTTSIIISNLDCNTNEAKLKQIFRMAGRIREVEMLRDKDNLFMGIAMIEYDHPVEAVQAISLFNNQPLYESPMNVRMQQISTHEDDILPEGLTSIGMGLGPNGKPFRDIAMNLPVSISKLPPGSNFHDSPSTGPIVPGPMGHVPGGGPSHIGPSVLDAMNQGRVGPTPIQMQSNNFNPGFQNRPTQFNQYSMPGVNPNINAAVALQTMLAVSGQAGLNQLALGNLASQLGAANVLGARLAALGSTGLGAAGTTGLRVAGLQGGLPLDVGLNAAATAGLRVAGFQGASPLDVGLNANSRSARERMSPPPRSPKRSRHNGSSSPPGRSRPDDSNSSQIQSLNQARGGSPVPSARIEPPPPPNMKCSDTIMVENLPANYTWRELEDKFREAGDIKFSEMRGNLGLVRFNSEWEALRAVSMFHLTKVGKEQIDVRLF